jgi:hypothetical protein
VTLDFRQIEDNQWEVFKISPAADRPIGLIAAKAGEHSFFPYVWQQPLELDDITLHGIAQYCDYLKQTRPQDAPAETKPATAEADTKTKGDIAAGLDAVAERILSTFKNEEDSRTDADLLAASGLTREKYLDVRDFILIETEEISELADTIPTEYIRNWPRKVEAAA